MKFYIVVNYAQEAKLMRKVKNILCVFASLMMEGGDAWVYNEMGNRNQQ